MCLSTASSVFNARRASPWACVTSSAIASSGQYPSLFPSPVASRSKRSLDHRPNVLVLQRFEYEHPASRQQRARQLEAGILGRRADQGDDAVLDPGQERILLRLVEPVDLVAEEDRALPLILQPLSASLIISRTRATPSVTAEKRLEVPLGVVGDDLGEGGLARAGRAPEDARADVALPDEIAQGSAGTKQVLLAQELVERFRAAYALQAARWTLGRA